MNYNIQVIRFYLLKKKICLQKINQLFKYQTVYNSYINLKYCEVLLKINFPQISKVNFLRLLFFFNSPLVKNIFKVIINYALTYSFATIYNP